MPSNQGGIQPDPDSTNRAPSKVNPSSTSKTDGSRPIIADNFNFYDGTMLMNGSIDNAAKINQAQFANAVLPSSIQNAFNSNEINYYDLGTGDFYYAKRCNKSGCIIAQIGRSCNAYNDAVDHQPHYILADSATCLELLVPNKSQAIPNTLDYIVQTDDNLEDIAKSFGIPFELLKAANSQVENSNNIYPGQSLIVPAQAYLVSRGDTLAEIADNVQSTLGSLLALNEITNPDYLLPGYFIRIPARLPNIPFAYTVHSGVNLADQYGVLLGSLKALKPQISD